ncbi:hypothetical protein [uncultured Pontibacter sp.]|uniref:hypothetical protein n=1 Tax=uncultured Pontibacter sp. TaxID=453356 RepID=UPI00261097AC|nr:hypothetical protein [uncultured Pontibacter sp.]
MSAILERDVVVLRNFIVPCRDRARPVRIVHRNLSESSTKTINVMLVYQQRGYENHVRKAI